MTDPTRYCSFFTSQPENWQPCSREHHDMVKAHPHEWTGYEVRALTAIPADQVLVKRESLSIILDYIKGDCGHSQEDIFHAALSLQISLRAKA
ncbi:MULTISPECIES: hypothetical protein [unclassified Pseudomonas]|uniref:hypothetical protein n=1 Tax=unclassified Pseudomonas TaxID=196821 RepID=UPI000B29720E|nr:MULTISPECIES: hypothetical protein [unclassified Pseudomonas]QOF85455.1 hypothetical protein IG194_01665 [Pseudomonas sp. ADPe]